MNLSPKVYTSLIFNLGPLWKRSNCRTAKWNGLWAARRMPRMPSESLKHKLGKTTRSEVEVNITESISNRLQTGAGSNVRAQRQIGFALSPIDRDTSMGDRAWTSRYICQSVAVVSTPSTATARPPEALYHIFAYLKKHENSARIIFDPKTPCIDERVFNSNTDWRDFYGDTCKELPPNMPQPKGKVVNISCFVDGNHAGNAITRQSLTGIIIFVQNAPIIWFSKRQNTVESSSFGSEFVALRAA